MAVVLDLTKGELPSAEKVAEIRDAFATERRTGDRRSERRMHPGRRAIDRMGASPAEMDRLSRGPDYEDHRDWEDHGDE